MFQPALDIHPSVQAALVNNKPIVALESTLLTHGLPYPENLTLSTQLSETLHAQHVTPATIAVISGVPHVGLTHAQLQLLCQTGATIPKLSTRDLATAFANRTHGATTVAATMSIASAAGIRVFATGGIGGVHRHVTDSWDISADISALSQYPMLVVCAGVKSILDVAKTLQALETANVPVFVLNHPSFPAFYTRDTDLPAPAIVPTPAAAARIFHLAHSSPACHPRRGALLAVPIPRQHQPQESDIQNATDTALAELRQRPAISSGKVTPFLLRRVSELTDGASLRANIQLVLNNAQVAAAAAQQLCRLQVSSVQVEQQVLVVGAAALDVHCKPSNRLRPGISNPGHVRMAAGGVAKNVAEAVLFGGGNVKFVSAVGDDTTGKAVIAALRSVGLSTDTIHIHSGVATATYAAVTDSDGELSVAIADMDDMFNSNKFSILAENKQVIEESLRSVKIACMDANLSVNDLRQLVSMCHDAKVECWFEPTTAIKCVRIVDAKVLHHVTYLSPNSGELKAIAERLLQRKGIETGGLHNQKDGDFSDAMHDYYAEKVLEEGGGGVLGQRIYCTRGARGVTRYSFTERGGRHQLLKRDFAAVRLDPERIKSTTGAGDCFAGVCLAGLARGAAENEYIIEGIKAAAKCCTIEEAVPRRLQSKM